MEVIQTAQKSTKWNIQTPSSLSISTQLGCSKVTSWQFLFVILMITFTNLNNMDLLVFLHLMSLSIFFPL